MVVKFKAKNTESTSHDERAMASESTTRIERTWFDKWQCKNIAKSKVKRQFGIINAVGNLRAIAIDAERARNTERAKQAERTID